MIGSTISNKISINPSKMLSTKYLDQILPTCIYNASGPKCTTLPELITLAQSPYTAATLTKSTTFLPRDGNEHPRYWENEALTINSTGLANLGYAAYGEFSHDIQKINPKKPYIVSVAGLSLGDNVDIVRYYNMLDPSHNKIDAIELNLSCPNVIGKPQIGYDLEATETLLRNITDIQSSKQKFPIPIGLKMPPYFDQVQITNMAEVIKSFPIVSVTCVNSLGNGLVIDPERDCPVIKPKGGLGGLGGDLILPIALSNVHQFRKVLQEDTLVIGCGGISTGQHAYQHILAGADLVQVGSAYMREEGINCFERITEELEATMKEKGYTHVSQFRNKLKEFYE